MLSIYYLLVSTTPKLKSSAAFGRWAVLPELMTAACEPQAGANTSLSGGCKSSSSLLGLTKKY